MAQVADDVRKFDSGATTRQMQLQHIPEWLGEDTVVLFMNVRLAHDGWVVVPR